MARNHNPLTFLCLLIKTTFINPDIVSHHCCILIGTYFKNIFFNFRRIFLFFKQTTTILINFTSKTIYLKIDMSVPIHNADNEDFHDASSTKYDTFNVSIEYFEKGYISMSMYFRNHMKVIGIRMLAA